MGTKLLIKQQRGTSSDENCLKHLQHSDASRTLSPVSWAGCGATRLTCSCASSHDLPVPHGRPMPGSSRLGTAARVGRPDTAPEALSTSCPYVHSWATLRAEHAGAVSMGGEVTHAAPTQRPRLTKYARIPRSGNDSSPQVNYALELLQMTPSHTAQTDRQ